MGYDARTLVRSDWGYCEQILPRVSRTFALNIGRLKGDVYRAVLLGYLLFRIADTFEDTTFLNNWDRVSALERFASLFEQRPSFQERLSLYEPLKRLWNETSPEKELVEQGQVVLQCYFELPEGYRKTIDQHIPRTSRGMARFQRRKAEDGAALLQLNDISDLEDYCYQVAGIVGEMLTQIFCRLPEIAAVRRELERDQIGFGLGLQTTNIVKDCASDLHRGWCYIPASVTERAGVTVPDLGRVSAGQHRAILQQLVPVIVGYFDATLRYILSIPERQHPVREFCTIAFVLAYNTLLQVCTFKGSKLARSEVGGLVARCSTFASSNALLREDYLQARRQLLTW